MRFLSTLVAVTMAMGWLAFTPLAPAHAATSGDLVTCPDFSSVYYLANDGSRWVFPNEKTYFTWYDNFDDVIEITCEDLATYPIGEVVTYQPGIRLVKIQSINKVYAVEPGGNLRWVQTESDAEELFGSNWASRIDDVPDGFWSSYTEGSALPEHTFPAGTLLKSDSTGFYYYVESLQQVGQESLTDVQETYALEVDDGLIQYYASGSISSSDWTDIKPLDRAVDANADELDYSDWYNQNQGNGNGEATDPPEAPVLTDPGDDGFSGVSFSLEWSEPAETDEYTYEFDTGSAFTNPTSSTLTGNTFDVTVTTQTSETYYFRVKASNEAGDSNWSNIVDLDLHAYNYIAEVPDESQPPSNTLGASNVRTWCAPMAAANMLKHFEDANLEYTSGLTAQLDPDELADYLGWFMDTNNQGSTDRSNTGMNGTLVQDIEPGLDAYAMWDGVDPSSYGYPVPTQLANKTDWNNYSWGSDYSSSTSTADAWDRLKDMIDDGRPFIASFDYWNPVEENITVEIEDTFEVHTWGGSVTDTTQSDWFGVGGTPTEYWTTDEVGHATTAVGYLGNYDAGDGSGVQDWIIVHDNWSSTAENVMIPFEQWLQLTYVWPNDNAAPVTPENVTATDPILELQPFTVSWEVLPSATYYEVQYYWDEDPATIFTSTTSEGDNDGEVMPIITNVPYVHNTTLWIQVRAVNNEGESEWSTPLEREVLMII